MNVLFLTLVSVDTIQLKAIYTDLLREFVKNDHRVYVISPTEKREGKDTHIINEPHTKILRLRIGDVQKTNTIKKGINTVLIGSLFKKAINDYFADIKFDLILYSTPPITLLSAIEYVKKRDDARTYLLLKDIFPQNAVDIGMMGKTGLKGLLYRYFRKQEKKLYMISDRIGCMSPANVEYVIRHNKEINPKKVEVCPNAIEVIDKSINERERNIIRKKYNIPLDKKVFIYGGNLGKPQGIPYLIKCLKKCSDIEDIFFLIVGDGTEYSILEKYSQKSGQKNLKLMKRIPKEDYDTMVGACDVGMIFLDHRFTIPNFPSRLLSYMQAQIPVLAVTDSKTDLGIIIVKGGFGWWRESKSCNVFRNTVKKINSLDSKDLRKLGSIGYEYLNRYFNVTKTYEQIIRSIR